MSLDPVSNMCEFYGEDGKLVCGEEVPTAWLPVVRRLEVFQCTCAKCERFCKPGESLVGHEYRRVVRYLAEFIRERSGLTYRDRIRFVFCGYD